MVACARQLLRLLNPPVRRLRLVRGATVLGHVHAGGLDLGGDAQEAELLEGEEHEEGRDTHPQDLEDEADARGARTEISAHPEDGTFASPRHPHRERASSRAASFSLTMTTDGEAASGSVISFALRA